MKRALLLLWIVIFASGCSTKNPLPSWEESENKRAIIEFVEEATSKSSENYVPEPERIAVFDNDGTLWSEKPVYFQLYFAMDRIKALAPEHPEWQTKQPFKAVLNNDSKAVLSSGKKGLLELIMASHAGMTTEEFEKIVKEWLETAKHPTKNKAYTELVYQPMLEILEYLRANGFKTYIVSGGGIEFMRPWVEKVYGIPPEQVVGSSIKTKFEIVNGKPQIQRLPEIDFIDDKQGKPVGIQKFIGRKPIIAFGNSDGDLQMLQWTSSAEGLGVIIRHTDAEREWKYDRNSHVGKLSEALDKAAAQGWRVVDMKQDWLRVYPFEK